MTENKPILLHRAIIASFVLLLTITSISLQAQNNSFTLTQVKAYPFPTDLTSSNEGSKIAWAFNEEGKRNIYVAEGPTFTSRRLTSYLNDDGQALSSISISNTGKWVVYIRGGDFGSNWDDALPVNPTFATTLPKVQIWSILFTGGEPILLGEGESPIISPDGTKVVFTKSGQIWMIDIDGSAPAEKIFTARGSNDQPNWSPDGSKLAFRSNRGDHSFIGIYKDAENPIAWMAPSFYRDHTPRWSPDSRRIAFIRQSGRGGVPQPVLEARHNPWKIMIGDLATEKAIEISSFDLGNADFVDVGCGKGKVILVWKKYFSHLLQY